MKPQAMPFLMTFMLSLFVAGCGGGGGGGGVTAFTVNSVTPANLTGSSVGVDTRTAPSAVFSNTIDTSFLTTKSFTLTAPGGIEVPSTVGISGATATLTPNQPLAFLTQYTSTIAASAKDSAGNAISGKYTWSFTTRDGQWKTQIGDMIDANTGDASNTQVAVDAYGNIISVWQQGNAIYANRYMFGSGWGTAAAISGTSVNAQAPQIAMDGSGDAIAAWQQSGVIYADRYTAGGWVGAVPVSGAGVINASTPQIAMDSSGDAIAVWQQGNAIYANRYTAGGAWGATPDQVSISGANPQIAMDAAGNAFVAWSSGYTVFVVRYAVAATPGWSAVTPISNGQIFPPVNPRVAVSANGDAFVVWEQQTGSFSNPGSGIFFNHYKFGTGWDSQSSGIPGITGYAYNPQISTDAQGNAVCIWVTKNGSSSPAKTINAARYLVDIFGWDVVTPISNSSVFDQSLPQVSMDANGNAIAAWVQNGYSHNIYVNRFRVKGGWDDVMSVSSISDTNSVAANPKIAMSSSGNAVVVWQQLNNTASANNTYANRFE